MIPIHVPARIHDIANVITKDLLTGTRYLPEDSDDPDEVVDYTSLEPDKKYVPVFTSALAQELKDFIDDLPTIYYLPDSGEYTEFEPEETYDECEECDGDGEDCPHCDGTGEIWHEPEPYRELRRTEVVAMIFGSVIAEHFK